MAVLIVPRGLDSTYYRFLKLTAEANGDIVIVDRRVGERRQGAPPTPDDRRRTDRRGPAPSTWVRDGVIVVSKDVPEQT